MKKTITLLSLMALLLVSCSETKTKSNTMANSATDSSNFKSGFADVNKLKIYYEMHGNGEPLLLLHGGLYSIDMYKSIISILSKNRQVIAVDLQGHGRTADIDKPLRFESMADDIAALIRFLNLGKVDIAGHSLGGGVALRVAIQHREVVKRLVVISAPFSRKGFYPEILVAQSQSLRAAAFENFKATPIYQNYISVAPKPENFPSLLDKLGDLLGIDYDWSEDIRKLKMPVMLIFSDADMFPTSHMTRFFELLGGGQRDAGWDGSSRPLAQLAILPGLTHYNSITPLLASTIDTFLDSPASLK